MTVLEINGKRVEVGDEFLSLTPEQQEATVEEIAQTLSPNEFNMGTLNRGIAQGFGGAVDLVNSGLNAVYRGVGLPEVEQPFGGSRSLMAGMDAIGADVAEDDAQTTLGKMVQGTGQAAGVLPTVMVPVGQAAKLADATRGATAGNTAKIIADDLVNRPVRSMTSELAAGAGAAYGGQKAQEWSGSDNPAVRGAGEVLGGLTAGLGPYAATQAAISTARRLPLTGTVIRGIRASLIPFTRAGGFDRASARLRGLSADPEGQAALVAADGPLSPAQRTGDKRLMALERAILDTDATLSDEFDTRLSEASLELRNALKEPFSGADIGDTRQYIDQRQDYLLRLLDTRIEQAQIRAEKQTAKVRPERRESVNAAVLRRELDKAYDQASAQERELWLAVPRDAEARTDNLRRVMSEIDTDTPLAQREDVPAIARRLLMDESGLPENTTVREVHGLYSKLRQIARNARSGTAPNENLARISNMLADAALDDLGANADASEVGRLINDARAFSRALNESFNQGTVGALRGKKRSGGDAIAPELSLATTIGRGGSQGAVAFDDMLRATGNREALAATVSDYLRARFQDQTTTRNKFSLSRAEAFLKRNREVVDRLPELAAELQSAIDAQTAAGRTADVLGARRAGLSDPRRSSAALVGNARTGEEIAAIFRARSPAKAAAAVKRQAAQDKTGQALAGLKSGLLDHLMQNARTGRFDDAGQPLLSGRSLMGQLTDPKSRQVLNRILSKEEMGRINRIAVQLRNIETAQGRLPAVGEPMNDTPNQVIGFVARIAAAKQGAQVGQGTGGGQLVIAGEFSKRITRVLRNLTNDTAEQLLKDAIQDPDLFRSLLLRENAPFNLRGKKVRSLAEWAIGAGIVSAQEFEEVQQ